MKKIALTPKATKIALVTGIFLICGGVLAVVLNNANAQVQTTDRDISSSSAVSSSDAPEISIAGINSEDSISHTASESRTKISSAFDPEKESSRSEPLTTSSKPTSKPPKPVVEGDSVDGKQPTNSALTDKSQKPTYTSKPTVTSKPSSKSDSASSNPENGEKKDGKTYDPDFGWIDGTGGGTGSTASDMYEDGVKVGIMD